MKYRGQALPRPEGRTASIIATMMAAGLIGLAGTLAAGAAEPLSEAPRERQVFPRIEGEISIEIQSDSTVDSDDPAAKITDTYPTVETALGIVFTDAFSLQSTLVLEPVLGPLPGQDRFFRDIGLYAEEIYGQYESGPLRLFAGKFDPLFGTAWDVAPGLYGTDFAEDYELAEMIGGGTAFTFGGDGMPVATVTGALFFADTTALSESLFTNRGRTTLAAGGPANTEDLTSFAIALDVAELPSLPGVNLHLGARRLAAGLGDPDDDTGFVAGINGEHELGDPAGTGLFWIAEVAHLNNAEATLDDITYVTFGAGVTRGPWNCAASTTLRNRDVFGGADQNDALVQGSCGYEVQSGPLAGIGIDAGVKWDRVAGVDSTTVGILFSKAIEFQVP